MVSTLVAVCAAAGLALVAWQVLPRKKTWDPTGKHCYVTGGSQGLGLALALLLARRGAHVSIVARDKQKLDIALSKLEAARTTPDQIFRAYSYSLDTSSGASSALDAAAAAHAGRCPDALFLCAGKSRPGFFIEQSEDTLRTCMDETYWVQAWTALAAAKRMAKEGVRGRIVFVASVLAYFSIVGYSTYSPGKFAVRGLAEVLQSECLLYGIGVHVAFPASILSPGFEDENKIKPKITLKIEESDEALLPGPIAEHLLKGVEQGRFHITYNFIGNVFRAASRGSSPGNHSLMSQIYAVLGAIALPIWRTDVDRHVRKHIPEHQRYLHDKGFFDE